jgi:hypothetical protein
LLPLLLVQLLVGCSICKCRVWSLLCCILVAEITCKVLLTCLNFVYRQAAQAVPNFLTQSVPESTYESRAADLYVEMGVLLPLRKMYIKTPVYGQQT